MLCLETLYAARSLAATAHSSQRYGEHSYTKHLDEVFSVAVEFQVRDPAILIATFLHDILEDTDVTETELQRFVETDVIQLVKAVTDPPGFPNRKTRKAAAYKNIVQTPGATVLKLCDRIANVRSCWRVAIADKHNKSLLGMYKKEYGAFKKALYNQPQGVEADLWSELDRLMAWNP